MPAVLVTCPLLRRTRRFFPNFGQIHRVAPPNLCNVCDLPKCRKHSPTTRGGGRAVGRGAVCVPTFSIRLSTVDSPADRVTVCDLWVILRQPATNATELNWALSRVAQVKPDGPTASPLRSDRTGIISQTWTVTERARSVTVLQKEQYA